jgi:uncharacterized delta-60 repeat protein
LLSGVLLPDVSLDGDGQLILPKGARASMVYPMPDGRFLVNGQGVPGEGPGDPPATFLARFNPDGTPDRTFSRDGYAIFRRFGLGAMALLPDGKLIATAASSGPATSPHYVPGALVVRLNPDGSLDETFGQEGVAVAVDLPGWREGFSDVAIAPDGKIVLAGSASEERNPVGPPGFSSRFVVQPSVGLLARLNPDGSPDESFGGAGYIVGVGSGVVEATADGKVVVGGTGRLSQGAISRYNADGSLDTGFGDGGTVTVPGSYQVTDLLLRGDGDVVALGKRFYPSQPPPTSDFTIARYNSDGSPDAEFGTGGVVTGSAPVNGSTFSPFVIVEKADGTFVVAGTGYLQTFVGSFAADGTPLLSAVADLPQFSSMGGALGADGKLVVAGARSHVVPPYGYYTTVHRFEVKGEAPAEPPPPTEPPTVEPPTTEPPPPAPSARFLGRPVVRGGRSYTLRVRYGGVRQALLGADDILVADPSGATTPARLVRVKRVPAGGSVVATYRVALPPAAAGADSAVRYTLRLGDPNLIASSDATDLGAFEVRPRRRRR